MFVRVYVEVIVELLEDISAVTSSNIVYSRKSVKFSFEDYLGIPLLQYLGTFSYFQVWS